MPPRRKKIEAGNTIQVAAIFLLFVVMLVGVSLSIKFALLLKSSKFDGVHTFIFALSSLSDQKSPSKKTEIISFDPRNQSITALRISIGVPIGQLGRVIAIPIDGTYVSHEGSDIQMSQPLSAMLSGYHDASTNLIIVDLVRLWWFEKFVPSHSTEAQDFSGNSAIPLDAQLDTVDQKLFQDSTISSEKESVAVINGADISGFGNRFARLLTNMGANVVSVTTSDSDITTTSIEYTGSKTYTIAKLEKILGVKAKKQQALDISNVVVKLGKDRGQTLSF